MRLNKYKQRYEKAKGDSYLWIALYNECYHYTVPSRNLFYRSSLVQGEQKNALVFDTTAVHALRGFVSKLQNSVTPPQQDWALLEAGTSVPEGERDRVTRDLQTITTTLFNYIHHSNFDLVVPECYYDLGIGTGVLIIHDNNSDDNPFTCYSVPAARIAIEESQNTLVESAYRWWDEIKVSDIMEQWPEAEIPQSMMTNYQDNPTYQVKELVEATMYQPLHKGPDKYVYCLWHQGDILLERRVESSPFIIFRWSKINNEAMGRGPVVEALPSIKSLNELARLEITAANFNTSKPYMAFSDGVFNPWTFRIEPNTVIPIAPTSNGNFPIQPFPDSANPAFEQLVSADLRQQINNLMYNQPLGPVDAPPKTATEVAMRQRQFFEEMGPSAVRLQHEFLPRVINRFIHILQKRGLLPRLVVNGREIQIVYKSPLIYSQNQKDVQSFMQWTQIMQGVMGPETAVHNIKPDVFPDWLADKLGVMKEVLNTPDEMKELYAQMAAQQQAQQQQTQEVAQAEASRESALAAKDMGQFTL